MFPLGLITDRQETFSWWFLNKLSLANKKWEEELVQSKKLRKWSSYLRTKESISFKMEYIRLVQK